MADVKIANFTSGGHMRDSLHQRAIQERRCKEKLCRGAVVFPFEKECPVEKNWRPAHEMKTEAVNFIKEYYKETKSTISDSSLEQKRIDEIMSSIDETGTYELTAEELELGAKIAWRNAPRCIGRQQWRNLKFFDFRHVKSEQEMYEACLHHLEYTTNGGALRSTITILPKPSAPDKVTRIWNSQLIRFAGYLQPDGSFIGDPESYEVTEVCKALGWVGKGGHFDALPLIIQFDGGPPTLYEIPESYVMRVKITHPSYPKLSDLNLEWMAVAAISNMTLEIGGLNYTCCPFNGWYMVTEVSVRNFLDEQRYNLLEPCAEIFGFDKSNELWKDRTAVEFTAAVLHSYKEAGVTMVDHHSITEQFHEHFKSEVNKRGGCPADWVWIVPPLSSSLLPVFHQEMLNYTLKPVYKYQAKPWRNHTFKKRKFTSLKQISKFVLLCTKLALDILRKRKRMTILYGTESGRSKTFARHLERRFKGTFWTNFLSLDQYNFDLTSNKEHFIAIVTSTFGNGEAPSNAEEFYARLSKMVSESNTHIVNKGCNGTTSLHNYKYAMFALGSRAYPDFCAFGHDVDTKLRSLGAKEILSISEGDELGGQEKAFLEWSEQLYLASCKQFDIDLKSHGEQNGITDLKTISSKRRISEYANEANFRISAYKGNKRVKDTCAQLSETHNSGVYGAKVLEVKNLQTSKSTRKTIFTRLATDGKNLSYQVGDSLALYPSNCKTDIKKVLQLCGSSYCPGEPLTLEVNTSDGETDNAKENWEKFDRFSSPISLNDLFSKHLDLTSPPTQTFLSLLAKKATDQNEVNTLQTLADNDQEYNNWKVYNSPTIVDVLEEFPSAKISLKFLITQLPLLKPRYYSISSSPKVHPNEIHLTAALLEYKTQDGDGLTRRGLCTSWMDKLNIGDIVPCYIKRSNKLRLPNTQDPIILVGPGTGIAPFRGFWQELQFLSNSQRNGTKMSLPEVTLFTGCRSPDLDVLFYDELEALQQEGVLTDVFCAFSRIPGKPKVYVQHLMKENGRRIYETLCKQNGHLFVCGGIEMARDVKQTVTDIIQEYSNTSHEESTQMIEHFKIDGKYHEEVFGVTFHGQVTKKENTQPNKVNGELKKKIIDTNHCNGFATEMMNGDHYESSLVAVN